MLKTREEAIVDIVCLMFSHAPCGNGTLTPETTRQAVEFVLENVLPDLKKISWYSDVSEEDWGKIIGNAKERFLVQ